MNQSPNHHRWLRIIAVLVAFAFLASACGSDGEVADDPVRGGTHIFFTRGGQATLDFIVDDIDDTHAVLEQAGARVTPIRRGNPHDWFKAVDPEGK